LKGKIELFNRKSIDFTFFKNLKSPKSLTRNLRNSLTSNIKPEEPQKDTPKKPLLDKNNQSINDLIF
jgi:hypothetical protein